MTNSWGPVRTRVERFLSRIDELDADIRAWVFVDRDGARAAADALDRDPALAAGSPARGLVVGVKDIIDVAGMPTGRGVERDARPEDNDADVVETLRRAGAVILGKTVTTPHAYLDPPPTRNPHDLSRTPGGSSSGSAAAVAAGMCDAAIGTQTGGSLVRPASFCGVHVIKPTRGFLALSGVRELARNLDHVGFMAGSLDLLERVFLGAIPRDDDPDSPPPPQPCVEIPERKDLIVLQVPWLSAMRPEMERAFDAAIRRLLAGGGGRVAIHRLDAPERFNDIHKAYSAIIAAEAARAHRNERSRRPDLYPPRIRELCEAGERVPAVDYLTAMETRDSLWLDLANFLQEHDLGAASILMSSATGPAPDLSTTGDPLFNSPWSCLGLPVIGLPLPLAAGQLPLGMQVIDFGPTDIDGSIFATARLIDEILHAPA